MFDITKLGQGDDAYDLVCFDYLQEHPEAFEFVLQLNKLPTSWSSKQYQEVNSNLIFYPTVSQRKFWLARNRDIPEVLLVFLATAEDAEIRFGVAANHSAPTYILHKLQQDSNMRVRDKAQQTLKDIEYDGPSVFQPISI